MANGEIIRELREIVQGDSQITAKTANRLTLAALADVLENQKIAAQERKELRENPAVKLGFFYREHPKRVYLFLAIFLSLMNVWFVSGFRQPILRGLFVWIGMPQEIVDLIP